MNKQNSTTKDLAKLVYRKLQGAKVTSPLPNEEILNSLFENLFYASIKTEESDFIKVTITLMDSTNPDPFPPERIVDDRWQCIHFAEPIPFSVKNIVKLSKAADPWSSSLAVSFNSQNELLIWGMIDQAVHYQSFLHYESESGPEQPGLFQTTITGIGALVVIFDYELIATLKQNALISNYLNVLAKGQICELLNTHNANYLADVLEFINKELPYDFSSGWAEYLKGFWAKALSRILLKIQSYKHGGAFLITNDFESGLDIKHRVNYDRLYTSLCKLGKITVELAYHSESITSNYVESSEDLPLSLYLNESVGEFTKRDINDELKGAIRFIASLSCIDGLVVFNTDLKVKGFGAVITNIHLPEYIFLSRYASYAEKTASKVSPDNFGTRHRSMFSYCWNYKDSLGFVVSQDGDIRAIRRIGDNLVMWENIKVQHLFNSNKLKKAIKPKVK